MFILIHVYKTTDYDYAKEANMQISFNIAPWLPPMIPETGSSLIRCQTYDLTLSLNKLRDLFIYDSMFDSGFFTN